MKLYEIKLFYTKDPLVIHLYEDQYNIFLRDQFTSDIIQVIEKEGHPVNINMKACALVALPKNQKYLNSIIERDS